MTTTRYTIGMDIGGTNTDAVLVDSHRAIVGAVKTSTTLDISHGVATALKKLLEQVTVDPNAIQAVYLGTTHATNAILQQRDLYRVGLIRIAGNDPEGIPPCYAWPKSLRETLLAGSVTIDGGYECHGTEISPFSRQEVRDAIHRLMEHGAESLAVVGVFSPLKHDQELEVEAIAKGIAEIPVSLSHRLGGIGFIDRENTTLLNAALKKVMARGFQDIQSVLKTLKLDCPLFITQNNGCVIDLQQAIDAPVLTISAGPTNSFIGASRLVDMHEAVIVDIGGTSTDVGLIKHGFPKRTLNTSNIGGVRLNFPMPDVLSIALGGGSYVTPAASGYHVGPQSAGMNIVKEALCFGGERLTLTDIAVANGHLSIPSTDAQRVQMKPADVQSILRNVFKKISYEIDRMDGGQKDLPVLLVGGGAALIPPDLLGPRHIVPHHANVANAYGAALAEVAGTVDTVISLTKREEVLEKLQDEARQEAVNKGADCNTVRVIDLQIIPYSYMPENLARVTVVAAGKQKCV